MAAFDYGSIEYEMASLGVDLDPLKGNTMQFKGVNIPLEPMDKTIIRGIVKELGLKEAITSLINNPNYQGLRLDSDKAAYIQTLVSSFLLSS